MLVAWGPRALYIGPSLNLAAHRNAVAVVAIALDGLLEVARVADQPEMGFMTCRTVLIEPSELHLIRSTGGDCAFLYLDALSDDLAIVRATCRDHDEHACFHLDKEDQVISQLATMARSEDGWAASRHGLAATLGLTRARQDPRIEAAIDTLTQAPQRATHVAALALASGLSPSRFQHLFKRETGLAFRRFRNWTRLRAALVSAQRGQSLTEAAHAAGFASSAHFSTAFKQMFGIAPSQLLAARPILVEDSGESSPARPSLVLGAV